jgi:hypothetical protein
VFNIRSVDLNLLPVFEAVYEEKSLSRAAVRLAMTNRRSAMRSTGFAPYSAMSSSCVSEVVPTPAADRVCPKVRQALASVRIGHRYANL